MNDPDPKYLIHTLILLLVIFLTTAWWMYEPGMFKKKCLDMEELGTYVETHTYSPPGFPDLELTIEIRQMRRSKKYFPVVENPRGGFQYWSPTKKTVRGALGAGKRAIEFMMEDEPLENEDEK